MEPAEQGVRVDEDERQRRALAERLARELAAASHQRGSDFVASRTVQSRLHSIPEVMFALDEAPTVIMMSPSSAVGTVWGPGGLVYWVHGPELWSMAFVFLPFTGLIRVCADDLPGRCVELYDDSDAAREAVSEFYLRVVHAIKHRAELIASGFLPPDPPTQQLPAAT